MSVDWYLVVFRLLWYKVYVNKWYMIFVCCVVWVILLLIVVLKQVEIFFCWVIELFEVFYVGLIVFLVIVFQVLLFVVFCRYNNVVVNMNEGSVQVLNLISVIECQLVVVICYVVVLLGISIIFVSVLVVLFVIIDI